VANDASIFVEKLEEKTLNDFIRKFDKMEVSQPGSPERSAHNLLGTDQH